MPPMKFEIVCFCPDKKKLSGGADTKTPPVTFLLLILYHPPKIYCYNPYLLLGKERRAELWGIGGIYPCLFKTGGYRGQTSIHPPELNLYPILF